MDRRFFLGVTAGAGALFGTVSADASSSSSALVKSVADLGVVPGLDADQTAVMQKAITELTAARQPVLVPPGRYQLSRLQVPSHAAIIGVPGLTLLAGSRGAPVLECINSDNVTIRSLNFIGPALVARDCRTLSVTDCQVLSSEGDGLVCGGTGLFIAANRASFCAGSAIWVEGDGMVTNNMISGSGRFGLRLGGENRLGTLTIINNMISGPAAGIAVSNSDNGYALIAMNMISGAAKGGIRALNGGDLIGKDLTKGGSEAFRISLSQPMFRFSCQTGRNSRYRLSSFLFFGRF